MDLIKMVTTTAQDVSADGIVPLTTIARRKGNTFINTTANSIIGGKSGYYFFNGTITFTVPTAGSVILQLYKNGSPIAGAITATTAAINTIYTLPITTVDKVGCCEGQSSFTLVNEGVEISTSDVELEAFYV